MNVIIPMAGVGSRLRPITPTTPKPLIKLSGKTIIHRIIEELYEYAEIKKIGFVLQQKNTIIESGLKKIVSNEFDKKIKIHFFYQKTPKGTAHAIHCAKKLLKGKLLIVFSDTLFFLKKPINFTELDKHDGAIFVREVIDPSSYGVVQKNEKEIITNFIEKPKKAVSNLAMIGVYYFKRAENLEKKISQIISGKFLEKNEYQLTTALENLANTGSNFTTIEVKDWLDCGTPNNLLLTNKEILKKEKKKPSSFTTSFNNKANSKMAKPIHVGKNVIIKNSTIGPNVSIEDNCVIKNSTIKNTIIQENTIVENVSIKNSILGKFVEYNGKSNALIIGPYSNLNRK